MKLHILSLAEFDLVYDFWKANSLWLYPLHKEKDKFKKMHSLFPELLLCMKSEEHIIATILGAFDGRTGTIHRLCVETSFRNKGCGKFLIKEINLRLKKIGCDKVSLHVHSSNSQVISFYEKQQFLKDDVITLKKNL